MLSGERVITHDRIFQFCEKLKISPSDFYYTATQRDRFELQKIYEMYRMMYTHDYSHVSETLSKVDKKKLISKQNVKFLEFCIVKAQHVHKAKSDQDVMEELKLIADYPKCLEKKTFDFIDINVLMMMAEIQIKFEEYETLNKLVEILHQRSSIITRTDTSQLFPTIFSNVSLFLCRLNRHQDAIDLASEGIKFSIDFNNLSSLAHLHYVKSHSLLQLGFRKDAEIEAARCIACAVAKENLTEMNVFFKELEFDHKINPLDLLKRHQDVINKKDTD